MKERIMRREDYIIVVYNQSHWALLRKMRKEALRIIEALKTQGLAPIVHGSIARGDVKPSSDIDVVVPYPVPIYRVVLALEEKGFTVHKYILVQATPSMTPKIYLALDYSEQKVVSFPLAYLTKTEYEFYHFGGALDYEGLVNDKRVPGVDKRLVLIEPTPEGHREVSILGREGWVAKKLGISMETVSERIRVLQRREAHGRTGVFIKVEAPGYEDSLEDLINRIARSNPAFRRVLRERGSPFL